MKVHELLSDPESWCQGALHEEKTTRDGTKQAYCIIGAIKYCYDAAEGRDVFQKVIDRINDSNVTEYPHFLSAWNDKPERTHAEVLQIVKELDV